MSRTTRMRTITFDFLQALACVLCVLLIVGVIPFTAAGVGFVILSTMFGIKVTL